MTTSPREVLPPIPDGTVSLEATVPSGAYWSTVVPRWSTMRVVDTEGKRSGSCLFYNAAQPTERYNAPDTVKIQNQVFITEPMTLFSDLGRIMWSITADTAGCHETLCGATTAATNTARYGERTYLEARNDYIRNDRDNFIAALGRHGLGPRDVVMPFNLWQRVAVAPEGTLVFDPQTSRPGTGIDLRAEMDVLVVVSNTPHVLDPAPLYTPGPLAVTVFDSSPPAADDPCRTGTPERARGAANSDRFVAMTGGAR